MNFRDDSGESEENLFVTISRPSMHLGYCDQFIRESYYQICYLVRFISI